MISASYSEHHATSEPPASALVGWLVSRHCELYLFDRLQNLVNNVQSGSAGSRTMEAMFFMHVLISLYGRFAPVSNIVRAQELRLTDQRQDQIQMGLWMQY